MIVWEGRIGLDSGEVRSWRQGGAFSELVMDVSAALLRRIPALTGVDLLDGDETCLGPLLATFHRDGQVSNAMGPWPAAGNWLLEPLPMDGMSRRVLPYRTL